MEGARERLEEMIASMQTNGMESGATSPGGGPRESGSNEDRSTLSRRRPRTFPYFKYLPYQVEDESERQAGLEQILNHLYVAVSAGDFAPGAIHWTRELRGWLGLKFDLTRKRRAELARLYYELALAPGIDASTGERFAGMFMLLTKRKHYLKAGQDLTLDWRPLFRELKVFVLPTEAGVVGPTNIKRNFRSLTKLCGFAQLYFDPTEVPAMLEEVLPYFSTSFSEGAFVVFGLINLLFPTTPPPKDASNSLPQHYLPTFVHLWSLMNRSKAIDTTVLDLFSRIARDSLAVPHVPFSEYGIFTADQSATIFTAILRLLEIPVGQATSPYSNVDAGAGLAIMLERDQKKHPIAHQLARWIVMSLSPTCLDKPDSILGNLEGLIQAVETFYHPSNSGAWTKSLAQLVFYLADFFVMRWNRERSGEMDIPVERQLNDALKKRFVLCLRDVIFMGIYAKSGTAMAFSLATLHYLAFLEPTLILPGALQRIYPAMQGLVEVHRTTSSLKALYILSRIMARTKGFRCHITTMLGLALPGIDANDLDKTINTLSYLQAVCYNVPFHDLTKGRDEVSGNMLAMEWITSEVGRMEQEGADVVLDYENDPSNEDEEMILRSSTASLAEFLSSFLGKVFTLLENLPDAARHRSGSPEENVVNTLPATFTPLLAALSPDLYDLALNKIAEFVSNHVIHQARDAMAFICNALCKVDPQKALKRFVPMLIAAIRTEIDDNNAASTRNTGAEVLPRDRGLVWSVSMLSMCVVHVGDAVLPYKDELMNIAIYMQQKCEGTPTVHISNYIHHLLLNLTVAYPVDYSLYEEATLARGLGPQDWGQNPNPQDLNIKWHVPSREELDFAVDLLRNQGEGAVKALRCLIDGSSPIKRDGTGKAWSDEVSRNLTLIRLLLSGVAGLLDRERVMQSVSTSTKANGSADSRMNLDESQITELMDDQDDELGNIYEEDVKPTLHYADGYLLKPEDPIYEQVHQIREEIGETLHEVHQFLSKHQEDDVACFTPLCTAYKSYFIDVGIERSAHVLDRVTRLLKADIHPYKISGLRKDYPRPLMLRRANVYHIERLRYNASARPKTPLDSKLLLDLADSSVSLYTDVRKSAQSAGEAAVKAVIGAKTLAIPPLLKTLENALKASDDERVKGALFSLLFSSLAKTIGRDWRFAPTMIKLFLKASAVDKPSLQKVCSGSTFTIMEFGRTVDRLAILDKDIVQAIAPGDSATLADAEKKIKSRSRKIQDKRAVQDSQKALLSDELVDVARDSHWKQASRTTAIVVTLGMRFDTLASDKCIDLLATGAIDPHPGLRQLYSGAMMGLFSLVETRALCKHSYENYLLDKRHVPAKIEVQTRRDDPSWTEEHLASFAQADAEYYVDHDYPGWLVWTSKMPAYKANCTEELDYDEKETSVLTSIGKYLTREWFTKLFAYLKQEPRDSTADRFRMANMMLLVAAFKLVLDGFASATIEHVKAEVLSTYGDGSDKHQHRATAEILAGLFGSVVDRSIQTRETVWEFCFPLVIRIFSEELTPENFSYWTTFLHVLLQGRDPRRAWPLVEWLSTQKLDMSSNAAFKESTKIQFLQICVVDAGWHFQLEKPILEDYLAHLDHPYKGVREAMGGTIAQLYRTRYHESYRNIQALIEDQNAASSLGKKPYVPSEDFTKNIEKVFAQLEIWRKERTPGQQTPSSYTSASKTLLVCFDAMLNSIDCTQLLPFFPSLFIEPLLHMMDIKEDQELQGLAYLVFRHIPNVPHQKGEDAALINALIHIGKTSSLWHQRLRVLINMQIIFFRRLFIISMEHQRMLFDCVSSMLNDTQLEVRLGAMTTLSGMIRCSPVALRNQMVTLLNKQFTKQLLDNPLPKKPRTKVSQLSSEPSTRTNTPTSEQTSLVVKRHAAVLGLGALVQAFPYASPPPKWIPGILATLASKANADPGMVGSSVKSVLADFKKTRQDTWHVDLKAFSTEQAEDLEGVLWKSYFA
ncbi:hypothetical protein MMC25_005852 [Agyrium rufum]|nr:hypothetical protein [Agyrium rufum]